MVTIRQEEKHYRVYPEDTDNLPRLRGDMEQVSGRIWEATTHSWLVPLRRTAQMRTIYIRHNRAPLPDAFIEKPRELPLRDTQVEALRYAQEHPSALLDMYMGMGKTRAGIELISLCRAKWALIVGPVGALKVWRDQLAEYLEDPANSAVCVLDSKSVSKKASELDAFIVTSKDDGLRHHIVVCNYESTWREPLRTVLLDATWDMILADEVHRVRGRGTKVSRFFGQIASRIPYRYGLSGEPLPHSILDAYGIYRFLDASIFGTNYAKFEQRYADRDHYGHKVIAFKNTDDFSRRYNSIRYHAGRERLQIENAVFNIMPIVLTGKVWRQYRQLENEFYVELEEAGQEINAPNVLVKYLRMQQLESGFTVTEEGEVVQVYKQTTPKVEALTDFLQDFPLDEKLVIFCRFTAEVAQIADVCQNVGRASYEFTGANKQLDEWKADVSGAVLVVNIKAGGEAIDLTDARYALFYSLDWQGYNQAIARVNRSGQKCAPNIYVMVPEGPNQEITVGRRVYDAHKKRRSLIGAITEGVWQV